MTWFWFLVAASAIVTAGTALARYGDAIADRTGLGSTWIGLVLVAGTTSLPELFTGVSASLVHGLPDIVIGDVLGSCLFNLLILSLIDALAGPNPLSARVHQGHALALGFGLLVLGVVGFGLSGRGGLAPLGWIGVTTPVVIGLYLLAMRLLFTFERRRAAEQTDVLRLAPPKDGLTLRQAGIRYGAAAAVVVVGASMLPSLGAQLAQQTGFGQALVGTFFIAMTTSLPEVAVSLAAVRQGSLDLAVGNILGSNLFNLLILALADVLYLPGGLLAAGHSSHMVALWGVVVMNALLLVGLTYRALRKPFRLGWDMAGIAITYAATMGLLYALRRGA